MPDTVRLSAQTLVKVYDASDANPVAIAELRSVGDITQNKPQVDVTRLSDTAVRNIAGLTDGQEVPMELYLLTDNATQDAATGLQALFNAGSERQYSVCPKGTTNELRFRAIITTHSFGGFSPGEPLKRMVTLKLTSAVSMAANTNP